MSKPLVSVGIPTYNRPNGLRKTIECIIKQTYTNLEIIISDNCSPGKETENLVREFQDLDHRIYYWKQEDNIGATMNFRFVLEKANGKYFMWAADDDEWNSLFIETCIERFKSDNSIVLCYSEAYLNNNSERSPKIHYSDLETVGISKYRGWFKVLNNQHRNTELYGLIKRKNLQNLPYFKCWGEDHIILFYISLLGNFAKIAPGLFTSGVNGAGSNNESLLEAFNVSEIHLKIGYFYQWKEMIKLIFSDRIELSFLERTILFFMIFYRFTINPKFNRNIFRGFPELLKEMI